MKKERILLFMLLFIVILPLITAKLDIKSETHADTVISEFKNPAIFNLNITNPGQADTFSIYTIVGVDVIPNVTFTLNQGESKIIQVKMVPNNERLQTPGTLSFAYRIEGQKSGIQEEQTIIRVYSIKNALEINAYNIILDSDSATIYVKNLGDYEFYDIKATFQSSFFDFTKTFSLGKFQKTEFQIELNKEQTKTFFAGDYTLTTDIEIQGVKKRVENIFRYTEKADVKTTESKSGIIIYKTTTEKTNSGNLPTVVQVNLKRNILSRLFTTFNIEPSTTERKGVGVYYTFQKEIRPGESFIVKVTTNWLYPIILILALILIGYLISLYTKTDLVVKKHSNFVKTKGGEFALKVTVSVRARKYVEKVNVVDRLPAMTKIFPKFMGVPPTRVDEKNRRIEWNLDSLQQYEERVFSYIIYSKIGVVGKFELPQAVAVYETSGKLHEAESNKVFFLTETPRKQEY